MRSDKLGEVAAEFEAVHNVERAQRVGSVHAIIPAADLRPRIADALERGRRNGSRQRAGFVLLACILLLLTNATVLLREDRRQSTDHSANSTTYSGSSRAKQTAHRAAGLCTSQPSGTSSGDLRRELSD